MRSMFGLMVSSFLLVSCGDMEDQSNEIPFDPSHDDVALEAELASVYLSDLAWSSAANGWGDVEKDKSNGERATGDGKAIKINGKIYSKGLGVHANSEIKYVLQGKYSSFLSEVGVDDEVDSLSRSSCPGTVLFQVYADNVKVFDSGVMNPSMAAKSLQVDLAGKQELRLVANSSGDNANCDHGDWAGARLVLAPAPTPAGIGNGLRADIFANRDLSGKAVSRTDAKIDFNWMKASPDSKIPADNFSVRWSGQVEPRYSGTYRFYTQSDDGVRLRVNNQEIINQWNLHSAREDSGTIALVAGQKYSIVMEYFEAGVDAVAKLSWSSAFQNKEVIPQSQLYSDEVVDEPILPPLAPSNVSVISSTATELKLAWSDNSNNETGFKVERKAADSASAFQEVAALAANVTTYDVKNLSSATKYYFRIRALNEGGFSDYSQEVEGTTASMPTPPPPPTPTPNPNPTTGKKITDYGAVANDGNDDAQAILAAANAAGAGGTVIIPSGTFNLRNQIVLPGNRAYLGQSGARLKGLTPEGPLVKASGDGFTFEGITFDGGGIFMDKSGSFSANNVFNNNVFRLTGNGSERNGINFTCGFRNTRITNNYFTSIDTGGNHSFGLYGYNYWDLTIANNEFIDIGAGMHIDAFGGSGNLLVEQNYLKGVKGMGLEFQGTATNLKFIDNWYEEPSFVARPGTANGNTFAYSLIVDKSSNIQILRNVMIAPKRGAVPNANDYVRVTFEVGGDNALVEDNYSNGGNHVLAMNDGVGTSSVIARNNKFINYAQAASCSFCTTGRSLTLSNNGNIRLSDVMESRIAANRKPGIGSKRY